MLVPASQWFNLVSLIFFLVIDELPFFDTNARSGSQAQPSLLSLTSWFVSKTRSNRKVIFTQTGTHLGTLSALSNIFNLRVAYKHDCMEAEFS
jgi:hypothetical protein